MDASTPVKRPVFLDVQQRPADFTRSHSEAARLGVFCIGADGMLFYANQQACERLGYSRAELYKMHVADINPEFPREAWGAHWDEIQSKGRVQIESVHQQKSGDTIPVAIESTCVQLDGHVFKLALVQDISNRKESKSKTGHQMELEERLRRSRTMDLIGQLTQGTIHDFNNLLQVVFAHSELALKSFEDSTTRKHIEQIQRSAEHASKLARQLLDSGREQSLQTETADVNCLVSESVVTLESVIGSNIRVDFRPESRLDSVRVDRCMLTQALMNLFLNARDAMADGGILSIETSRTSLTNENEPTSERPHVLIQVSDTGTGMDQHTLERMFEPFFTTKPQGYGTGLGLSMVQQIVTRHGGLLDVQSELGRGSCFKIYLPV